MVLYLRFHVKLMHGKGVIEPFTGKIRSGTLKKVCISLKYVYELSS